jgi:hypothetical protein
MSNWSETVEFKNLPGWVQQKLSGEPLTRTREIDGRVVPNIVSLTEDINAHVLSAEEVADRIKEAKEKIKRAEEELQFWAKAQKPVDLSWWFSASGIFEALVRSGSDRNKQTTA